MPGEHEALQSLNPSDCRDPGQGLGRNDHPLMHNGVISVDEVSRTNMSKLYDYARSHIWVDVVAQAIGWSPWY